jgi:EAL domain-containing protein (putative c-di-GMP-specific phosphodiesterase class I)/CHASE2 domain-containing sensor protein/GGDEF domain-containing protein
MAVILFVSGALEPIENRLTELRARVLDRAPTGQVAVVEIDAKSLAAMNTWPWSRRYHAGLIRRLGAARASMIAFDVDFSARSDPGGDAALATALKSVDPVILPIFQQRASDDPRERLMIKSRPAAPFSGAWVGGVNIIPGRDGVVRDFPAATMINGQIQPAMAVLLSDNGTLGDRAFVPDWSINLRDIPRFSFIDVLENRVPAKAIAGKRIIVGATAIELGDRYTIPRFGTVPGVLVQALATESLIQHRALTRSGMLVTLVGLLLVSLFLAAQFKRFGRTFPLAAGGLVAMLFLIPAVVQSRSPLSIDTAPLLVASIGGIFLRIAIEVRHRIRLAALRDVETGLPNDRALSAMLGDAEQEKLILTAAAVERFETIRDAIGSADIADLIASASARLEETVGSSVYRIAPDTLAWVTPPEIDPEQVSANISAQFTQPVVTGSGPVDVQWTFGMAARTPNTDAARLIERSLAAIGNARTQGRSRKWFQGVAPGALRDLSIMGELRRGIEEDQLFVAYQPKLHLKSGSAVHAEALVRWRHPTEGLVSPDRFIPLAEETGVVREITRFILRRVIADCRAAEMSEKISVSINVSAADISQPDFADEVIEALTRAKLDPSRITLEITESAIIRSKATALRVLETLRSHGVRLSIDDYGTGQSTLSYVKSLPVDELKIDKSFVTNLCKNENDRIMVQSTIDLAHQLGLTVVAEGAEDWDTVKLLTELGCDYAQGYAVGRALALADLLSMAGMRLSNAA